MLFSTRQIGDIGEQFAEKFLRKNGYKILERNFLRKCGEIDIIASKGEYIVFVEVKTRKTNSLTQPVEAVTKKKIRCIVKTASLYLAENKIDSFCRFDICEVFLSPDNHKLEKINYIEDAFYGEQY